MIHNTVAQREFC